jgi:hypothetical protein
VFHFVPVQIEGSAANFIAARVKCTVTNERPLSGSQAMTVSDGSLVAFRKSFSSALIFFAFINIPQGNPSLMN